MTPREMRRERERLESRVPRAARIAAVFFELSRTHGSQDLEDLAIEVDGEHVQAGRELSENEVDAYLDRAAATFRLDKTGSVA